MVFQFYRKVKKYLLTTKHFLLPSCNQLYYVAQCQCDNNMIKVCLCHGLFIVVSGIISCKTHFFLGGGTVLIVIPMFLGSVISNYRSGGS